MTRALSIGTWLALGLALAGTTANALAQNWTAAIWAMVAAAWIAIRLFHRCPKPTRTPDRGLVAITFTGGPLDGADIPLPGAPPLELLGEALTVNGTTYRINGIAHTCYNAEAAALAEGGEGR